MPRRTRRMQDHNIAFGYLMHKIVRYADHGASVNDVYIDTDIIDMRNGAMIFACQP